MHLIFVVNHVAFFASHRLPIAAEARRRGWQVTLITGMPGSDSMEQAAVSTLLKYSIRHYRLGFGSATVNPFREVFALFQMVLLLKRLRGDIVHCASPKGVIYGGIAARISQSPALVLAVSGLGYSFTPSQGGSWRRSVLRFVLMALARLAFVQRNRKVIVQNLDDLEWVVGSGLASRVDVSLIPGSGVDLALFKACSIQTKEPLVVFPARLLRDKGVVEFIDAVRRIKHLVPGWRFLLAGASDYRNPSSILPEDVRRWVAEGVVEAPGHVQEMATLFARASIVCLPSYREGMPKALLEAAASGCAVITTDVTGCREAVVRGETGDLVPVRDVSVLATALLALIRDRPRRESYGRSGRMLAERRFGIHAVVDAVFGLYSQVCPETHGASQAE